MTTTAALLANLDAVLHETLLMRTTLDAADGLPQENVREVRRRVEEIRMRAQELFDLLSNVWLEERTN
jgi:hypothetical protein